MRTNVSFRHPAEFVPVSDTDGILAVEGARWFAALLKRVPDLQIDGDLCQEDWGVVVFARRGENSFWIGLSNWEDDGYWLAHFHHGSFPWLQRFKSAGKQELERLVSDFHLVLANEPEVTEITWYEEREMRKAQPTPYLSPV
jgi:hypothetical protein